MRISQHNIVRFFLEVILANIFFNISSQNSDSFNIKYIEKIDSAILNPDSIKSQNYSSEDKKSYIVTYPDIYYEYRIEKLDKKSPIKLDFNKDVRKYIDIYLDKRAIKVSEFLGLEELYFPIFEEYLDKYNLPLELKYLPIVESGLNPLAQSSSGAMGLWQLLLNSSKLLGLDVSSYKDERCDPYLSTDAACRYLKYLYSIFNDWQLVLAAYNGGPGEVRNAIMRSGGKPGFWQIQNYLPEQTKWYVPAYIAVVYLSNYAQVHKINPKPPVFSYQNIDTLMIHEAVEFSKISEKTGISIENLCFLNPSYRRNFIPDLDKPQALVLPSAKVLTFLKMENQIYSRTNDTTDYLDKLKIAGDTLRLNKVLYTVSKGDFLHKIALRYGCTVENLRAWNKLESDNLKSGEVIIIWIKNRENPGIENLSNTSRGKVKQYFYYTVKKGDTIWGIASRFNCDSINTIKTVNNIKNDRDLKPGQKLKILVNN